MIKQPEELPLIQFSINGRKLKHYLGIGLGKIRKLGEFGAKTIIKALTILVLVFLKTYKKVSSFAKSKQRGVWILLLILLFSLILFLFWRQNQIKGKDYQELKYKHEQQLEEYQDLMEQKYELEKKLEELENKPPAVIYRYKSQGLSPEIKAIVAKYASVYEVDQSLMECMVNWESGGNSNAISPSGEYVGVAQYCLSTFLAHRRYLGLSEEDLRTNPDASIQLLAAALARGEGGHWPTAYPACS